MDEIYKVASTERIPMLERTGDSFGNSSSNLQMAESKPLVIQADVMQRELKSCLRRKYTPENLPLLLLQKEVAYIMQEYSNALQRAERLSVAQENLLMRKNNSPNLVTREDLTIYTKWLVCHLRSLKTIHHYLQVCETQLCDDSTLSQEGQHVVFSHLSPSFGLSALQYLPISNVLSVTVNEVPEVGQENEKVHVNDINPDLRGSASPGPVSTSTSGLMRTEAAVVLPQHTTDTEELKPQLRLLLSHFNIQYDVEELRDAAKETELFSVIKPKCDPWQKKLLSKLKERRIDPANLQGPIKFYSRVGQPKGRVFTLFSLFQRICLGILNYFRCVERTLTINTSALMVAGSLVPTIDNSSWVNMANRGMGTLQVLRAHHYVRDTPAEHSLPNVAFFPQIHSVQFMEFLEVENQDDYYSTGAGYIYTQDQQGVHVMYDEALSHLKELETELLLVASHYTERKSTTHSYPILEIGEQPKGAFLIGIALWRVLSLVILIHFSSRSQRRQQVKYWPGLGGWAHAGVDRFAVLYDMWSCEAARRENKCLLDSYFEAYQHVWDPKERLALAVITDIMHRCPKFDLSPYFIKAYQDECTCLRLHLQLVSGVLNQHVNIEHQCEYVQRFGKKAVQMIAVTLDFPLTSFANNLFPSAITASKNIYLLEFHPSLGLASLIPRAFEHFFPEAHISLRPGLAGETRTMAGLDLWLTRAKPESWYSAQLQKDLFSAKMMGDPFLVGELGLLTLKSAAAKGQNQGQDFHMLLLEMFSELLELVTLHHQLIEMMLESEMAWEMGFEEFHLYLRPVHFEFASHKDKMDHSPPVFITSLLENSDHVDRYYSTLVLAISELDDNQDCKFRFYTKEAIPKLLFHSEVENMQVTLACQAAPTNALTVTVRQAPFYYTPRGGCPAHVKVSLRRRRLSRATTMPAQVRLPPFLPYVRRSSRIMNGIENLLLAPTKSPDTLTHPSERSQVTKRAPEAFVSIQLEKAELWDMMLNAFLLRKPAMADGMKSLMSTVRRFPNALMSSFTFEQIKILNLKFVALSLSGIMAYCNSLRALLGDFPTIRDTFFLVGQPQEKKGLRDSKADTSFQRWPRSLLSADGKTFLNLRFIPYPSEVLVMFKTLPEKSSLRTLKLTLQLICPLRDIVAYLFSFAKLGNCPACFEFPLRSNPLRGDWGGTEGIGSELQELQKMIDSLQSPQDPAQVSQALPFRREIMFLQFNPAIRHLIWRTFWAAGNIPAYPSVTGSMYHGLPPLSNSLVKSIFALQLSLPQPLDPRSLQAFVLFPWRAFLEDGGPFPVMSSCTDTLEYAGRIDLPTCQRENEMQATKQLCLCRLSDRDLKVAHGELVGMQLLMEGVLLSSYHMIMECPLGQQATLDKNTQPDWSRAPGFRSQFQGSPQASELLRDPCDAVMSLTLLRSFLVLWKQLEVPKEHWGRRKRGQDTSSFSLHKQFSRLHGKDMFVCNVSLFFDRTDILYPSMKAIARWMGKECEFEGLIISSQSILAPKGASEIEIKTQLQKLLENLEIHMTQEILRKVSRELTLVVSEKSKEQCTLPTDLWKHQVMKENFSVVRPQIVENFIQRLMENFQHGGLGITFRKDHLEAYLLSLGCDAIVRERSNFESYSMYYEHMLEHARQKLCSEGAINVPRGQNGDGEGVGRESLEEKRFDLGQALLSSLRELAILSRGQRSPEDYAGQVAELSHNMILEITALGVRLTDLEEENPSLKNQIRKEVPEEYEALVRALFMTCLHMKEKLDENQLNLIQKLCELISEVRTERIDHMKDLKKQQGSAIPDEGTKENPAKGCDLIQQWHVSDEQLRDLEQDNCSLTTLVCKVRSLGCRRLAVQQARFQGQLRAEKAQLLKELEHRVTQEALHWQQLDFLKTSSMEKLLEDVEQKEQQLQQITEEAEQASKLSQLQRKKIHREVRQMRSRLAQERSMKLDAFQRVEELQSQLNDATGSSVQMSSPGGLISLRYSLNSASTSSRYLQQHLLKTNLMDNKITRRIQRPKTVPIKHQKRTDDGFLPNMAENVQLSAFQVPTAPSRISL
ncbi:LOW QUALITY PROTEIN: uncharacterized protein RBU33_014186 [Hipposideros larvatus]